MRSDTSIRCWEDNLGHTVSCIFGVIVLYIYGGWLPYKLRRAVYKLGELKFDPYHKNFEFVLLGQKLVLVMIQRFLYFSWQAQVAANLIVNGGLLRSHIKLYWQERAGHRAKCVAEGTKMPWISQTSKPYYDHNLNLLSATIFFCELAFVLVGIACQMQWVDENLATYTLIGLFAVVVLYFIIIFRRPPCDFTVLEGRYAGYRSALMENARDLAGIQVDDKSSSSADNVEAMELQQAAMLSSRNYAMSTRSGSSTRLESSEAPSQRTPDVWGESARSESGRSPVVWGEEPSPTEQSAGQDDEQESYLAYLASLKSAADEKAVREDDGQDDEDGWDDDQDDGEQGSSTDGDGYTDGEGEGTGGGASSAPRPSLKVTAQMVMGATKMKLWV